jgi:hypothetical protein
MANLIHKDARFKIDDATGSLADITAYVNNLSIDGVQDNIEDTALSDGNQSFLPGVAGATGTMNGMVNTTTDAIFGALIGQRTSKTKTVELMMKTGALFLNGEAYPSGVTYGVGNNALQTFSCNLVFDGALNQTSVAL